MKFASWIAGACCCATVLGGSLALLSAPGFAHGGATGVVKARMDLMGDLGKAMKSLGGMARGKTSYNAEEAMIAGESLNAHGGNALTDLFPEGSLEGPSEAREEIWTDWDRFAQFADQLQAAGKGIAAAAALQPNATSLPDDVKAAFGQAASSCSGCHKAFRLKR
ncbi:c-type cytochrome [Roseibium sp.]|uniref:c-type cytochrome n=1 Tax=Roseibium sp. TaxID=1936156 RepID=UPI003A9737D0